MMALETTRLFAGLRAEDLRSLETMARLARFPANEVIFREGDPGDGLYVVKRGRVQISGAISSGGRRVFTHVLPGDCFGDLAVLDGQSRSACAMAEEETEVWFIPRDPFLALVERSPRLATLMIREISGRLRDFNQQYLREVLQAERMALVGRFAGAIVHDLKNPLTVIQMAADMLAMDSAGPETRQTARQRINKQVERIRTLVNDILDFTQGQARQPQALPGVNYRDYLQQVIQEIQAELVIGNARILCAEPPPVKIPIHPQRLSRVFYNLIGNAAEAMPDGGDISLHFRITPTEVWTEIRDTGPGLAPEILDRMFEPFTTFGKPKGTGLGLSIARRIVEEHGGRIEAKNLPEGGAFFTFSLPRGMQASTNLENHSGHA